VVLIGRRRGCRDGVVVVFPVMFEDAPQSMHKSIGTFGDVKWWRYRRLSYVGTILVASEILPGLERVNLGTSLDWTFVSGRIGGFGMSVNMFVAVRD
jgi:hypothetical protein